MKGRALVLTAILVAIISALVLQTDFSDSEHNSSAEVHSEEELMQALSTRAPLVIVKEGFTVTHDLCIPEGTTVLLPIDDTNTTGFRLGDDPGRTKLATGDDCKLTLVLECTVNVRGSLVVGGVIGCPYTFSYQGHTSSDHTSIINNGRILIEGQGQVTCFGFIRGSGTISALSGARVTEPAVITDFTGGDTLVSLYNADQGVFNRFSLPNIQCEMSIASGARLVGHLEVYANEEFNGTEIEFVGEGGAFIALSRNSEASFTYDPTRSIGSPPPENNLHSDIGKTTLVLRGGATFNYISITMSIGGGTHTLTYENRPFSIPYTLDIRLTEGVYQMNNIYRILPGSTMTVEEGAYLNLSGTLTMYPGLNDVVFKDTKYPTIDQLRNNGFDVSGRLVLKGTLFLLDRSKIQGVIDREGDEARIITSERFENTVETVAIGCNKNGGFILPIETHNYSSCKLGGWIVCDGELRMLESDRVYRSSTDSTYTMSSIEQSEYSGPDYKNLVGRTYALGSTFKGGWTDEAIVYTPVPLEPGKPLTMESLCEALLAHRTVAYYTVQVDLPSESQSRIGREVVQKLANDHGQLEITFGTTRISMSENLWPGIDSALSIKLDSLVPSDRQRHTMGDRTFFTLSLGTSRGGMEILPGGARIDLPVTPSPEDDLDRIQLWHISDTGKAVSYPASYAEGRLQSTLPCTGIFAISYEDLPSESLNLGDAEFKLILAAVVITVLCVVAVAAYLLHRRK
ncbi:MAG: hypothetical protein MJZ38_01295 [archaeon]|nr:hypothetical protein [archaeon]